MIKNMMMTVGQLSLPFQIEEKEIPKMLGEIFGDDRRQIAGRIWVRTSAITVVGEVQAKPTILSPQQMKGIPIT